MLSFTETFQNKSKLISRRMFMLSSLKIIVFISIVSRLFYLQISENLKYKSLSDNNRFREWKIAPQRGVIVDFFGEKIASHTQTFQLHMIPEDVPSLEELFFRLARIIDFSDNKRNTLIKRLKKRKPWEPIIISENLSWSEFSKLNLFSHEMQGVKPVVVLARKYDDDGSSAHLIGYVSDTSVKDLKNSKLLREINVPGLKTGKNGLEKILNEKIIGKPGIQRFEVNAYGKRIKELKFVEGSIGQNFKTTIDKDIQKYANKLIQEKSASVCVMDIYTGDLVCMVSSPTFNPNKFVHGVSSEDWKDLIENERKPLLNKSLSGLYPPGSTIKPIVALSALENDVISPKLVVQCTGHMELYGQKYHCWKEKGHGYMGLRNAIKQSCDIYFYEVARLLGVDRLAITAKKYGLGEKVLKNYFFEEKSGLIPSTQWKLKNIGRGWVLGETLLTGIGQGYIQCTPLELCLMIAQIANGGFKIRPRIIDDGTVIYEDIKSHIDKKLTKFKSELKEEFITADGDLDLIENESVNLITLFRNHENVKFVNEAMYAVSNEFMGTAYASRYEKKQYQYAGKTGTAQIKRITEEQRELELETKDIPYEDRDHALFIAFAPFENPRYAISVLIEHGGSGGKVAAPLAKKVVKVVIDRHELREKVRKERRIDI